jgi:hypothetical protein
MNALPQYQASEAPQTSENRLPFTETPFPEEPQIPIKAYFKYELAEIYGVLMSNNTNNIEEMIYAKALVH